jgi:hypothetical protein
MTTNLVPWGYTIMLDGWPRSVHIVVPATNTVVNAVSLINPNQYSPLNLNTIIQGGATNLVPGFGVVITNTATNTTISINPSNALPVALVVTNNDSQPITLTNINNQITAQFSSQALGDAFDTPWLQVTNNLNDDILQDAYIGGDNGLPDLWMLSDTAGTGALQIFTNSTVFMGNQNGFVDVASNGSVYIGNGFPQGSGSGAEFVPGVAGAHYAVVTTGEFFGNGGGLTNATTALPANTNGLVSAAQAATIAAQYAGGNGLNVTLYFTNTLPAAQVISNYFTDLIPTSWQFYLICTNTDTATGLKPGNTIPIEAINAANALFAGQANAAEPSFLPLIGTNYVIVNSPNSFNFSTAANWKYPTLAPGYASPTATVNFNLISIITGTHTNQGGGGGGNNPNVLYYKLATGSGTTATDSSGNSFNGTMVGTPTWVTDWSLPALQLNGISQYITSGTAVNSSIVRNNITVNVWIDLAVYPSAQEDLVSWGYDGTGTGFELALSAAGYPSFITFVGGSTHGIVDTSAGIPTGKSMVTGTYDGTTYKVYVNGVLGGSSTDSTELYNSTAPITVGAIDANGTYQNYLPATIKDASIWNAALTQSQIATIYATGPQ